MNLEAEGSVQAGNPDAASAVVETSGKLGEASTDVWSGLQSEDNRKTVAAKSWQSPEDAITSYRELEKHLGETKAKSLIRPGDDAKPEDWDAFYDKAGRPKAPGDYSFKLPEGLPENFPYDQTSADKFKNWAHSAGLPPREAQRIHDEFVKDTAAQLQSHAEQSAKAVADAHEALVKGFGNPADAWGEEGSETYKRKQELANRALRQQGGSELIAELKAIGALGPNGEVKSPRMAMMLSKIGADLYAEDTLYGGINNVGPNPFSDATRDETKQGQIIRNNPDHARALMRQAGIDPKEYGL